MESLALQRIRVRHVLDVFDYIYAALVIGLFVVGVVLALSSWLFVILNVFLVT